MLPKFLVSKYFTCDMGPKTTKGVKREMNKSVVVRRLGPECLAHHEYDAKTSEIRLMVEKSKNDLK